MMNDFVSDSFFLPEKIYVPNAYELLNEKGFPKSFTQFIS